MTVTPLLLNNAFS